MSDDTKIPGAFVQARQRQASRIADAEAKEERQRQRLLVLGPEVEINVGPLLASGWKPILWSNNEGELREFGLDKSYVDHIPEQMSWYEKQIKEGFTPTQWKHGERGHLVYDPTDNKWKHVDPLPQKRRRWPMALGPKAGKKGEDMELYTQVCLDRWDFDKIVVTGEHKVAEVLSVSTNLLTSFTPEFRTEFSESWPEGFEAAELPLGKYRGGNYHPITFKIKFLRSGVWACTLFGQSVSE